MRVENLKELEEVEADNRGMAVSKYRDHACDVYYKALRVIKIILGQGGETIVFNMVLQTV